MDTFSSVDYDQRSQMHHHHDYGVETSDTALFDNIINSYEKSDHELDGELLTGTEFIQQIWWRVFFVGRQTFFLTLQ